MEILRPSDYSSGLYRADAISVPSGSNACLLTIPRDGWRDRLGDGTAEEIGFQDPDDSRRIVTLRANRDEVVRAWVMASLDKGSTWFFAGMVGTRGGPLPQRMVGGTLKEPILGPGVETAIRICGIEGALLRIFFECLTNVRAKLDIAFLSADLPELTPRHNSVGFVAANSNVATSASSVSSGNITPSGDNRMVIAYSTEVTIAGVGTHTLTYAGGSGTSIVDYAETTFGGVSKLRADRFMSPATSANQASVTRSGGNANVLSCGVAAFDGVDQTTPVGTPVVTESTATSISVNVPDVEADDMVNDLVIAGSTPIAPNQGNTSRWEEEPAGFDSSGSSTKTGTGTVTIGWSVPGGGAVMAGWRIIAAPLPSGQDLIRVGSAVVDASGGNGSTSVDVPANCNAVVAFWGHWNFDGGSTLSGLTLDGDSFLPAEAEKAEGVTPAETGVGVAVLVNPSTGTQTLAWTWSDNDARAEGGEIILVYIQDANTADPVRDAAVDSATSSTDVSVTIDTESDDLVLGFAGMFNFQGSEPGTPDISLTEFIDNAVINSHMFDVGEDVAPSSPSTTVDMTGEHYSWIAAISLKAAAPPGGQDLIRVVDESIQIAVDQVRALQLNRIREETVQLSEAVIRAIALARAAIESVEIGESLVQVLGKVRIYNETVQLSETLLSVLGRVRVYNETVQVSEILLSALSRVRVHNETIQLSESISKALQLVRSIDENVSVSETLAKLMALTRILSEDVSAVEALTRSLALIRTRNETVDITETLVRILEASLIRVINESVQITEGALNIISTAIIKVVSEIVQLSESANIVHVLVRVVQETIQSSESLATSRILTRLQLETVQLGEQAAVARAMTRLIQEVVQTQEELIFARTLIKVISESLNISEDVINVDVIAGFLVATLRIVAALDSDGIKIEPALESDGIEVKPE